MKIYLESYFEHRSAMNFEVAASMVLKHYGYESFVNVPHAKLVNVLNKQDIYICRGPIREDLRAIASCFGGQRETRVASLLFLESMGFPTMNWFTAENSEELEAAFDHYGVEYLILKKSGTYKGMGVFIFRRAGISHLDWNPKTDVFCIDVNLSHSTVYKAECFDGEITSYWNESCTPIADMIATKDYQPLEMVSRTRTSEIKLPANALSAIKAAGRAATSKGLGYISFDLMKSQEGEFVAIELNTQEVATWWSGEKLETLEKYAYAVVGLVDRVASERI